MIYVHVMDVHIVIFTLGVTYIIYIISECLVLCCKAEVLKEGGKKIKPQDMLEDIPDQIIGYGHKWFKGYLNTRSMEATEGYR